MDKFCISACSIVYFSKIQTQYLMKMLHIEKKKIQMIIILFQLGVKWWAKSEIKKIVLMIQVYFYFRTFCQSKFIWFLFPGFEPVYQNNISIFFFKYCWTWPNSSTNGKNDSNISGVISTAKYFLAGAAAGPLGL